MKNTTTPANYLKTDIIASLSNSEGSFDIIKIYTNSNGEKIAVTNSWYERPRGFIKCLKLDSNSQIHYLDRSEINYKGQIEANQINIAIAMRVKLS